MVFDIDIAPLSVNKVWQGRRFKTPEYKQYERDAALFLPEVYIDGEVYVYYIFGVKYPKKCDVDNFVKPIQDIIVKKGILKDDRYIKGFQAEKVQAEMPFIKVRIEKFHEDNTS